MRKLKCITLLINAEKNQLNEPVLSKLKKIILLLLKLLNTALTQMTNLGSIPIFFICHC